MKQLGNLNYLFPPYSLGNGNKGKVAYTDLANVFTVAQEISKATAGTMLTFTNTANDANAQVVDYYRHRGGADGQDGDDLTELQFNGNDDGTPTKTKYARILAEIVDSGVGSMDGRLSLGTMRAGSSVDWRVESGAIYYQTLTAPSAAGAINGTDVQANDISLIHGVVQSVRATYATYTEVTTDFPCDNSIPQNTEGDEIITLAITPKVATSTLRISFNGMFGSSSAGLIGVGLFVDATAGALNANSVRSNSAAGCVNMQFVHTVSAGSTAARTYKIRFGPDVGGPASAFINGDNASRIFGGVSIAHLEIDEILAQ